MELNRANEQKKKQVRDEEENKDKKAFVMYKESVMKKHKNVSAERQNWLKTVKINAREELRRLSLSKARKEEEALFAARTEDRNTLATLE